MMGRVETRTIITLILLAMMSLPAWGFKFYGPNGWMEDSSTPEERQQREEMDEAWREEQARIQGQSTHTNPRSPGRIRGGTDNTDMSGVEWRQSRAHYSGRRGVGSTRPYGFTAGQYVLEYDYSGGRHFAVWMRSRRGLNELLVNRIGKLKGQVYATIPQDDEVWFEVESRFGNWELTFERRR